MSPESKYKLLASKIENIAHKEREQDEQERRALADMYKELTKLRKSDVSNFMLWICFNSHPI